MEHLRKNTKEYVGAVHNFLEDVYFSKLPSSSDSEKVFEAAEVDTLSGNKFLSKGV